MTDTKEHCYNTKQSFLKNEEQTSFLFLTVYCFSFHLYINTVLSFETRFIALNALTLPIEWSYSQHDFCPFPPFSFLWYDFASTEVAELCCASTTEFAAGEWLIKDTQHRRILLPERANRKTIT